VAVIVALVLLETRDVPTLNVAEVAPAATVTLLGTVAAEVLLLDRVTVVAELAAAERVTVPCELEPPLTLVGFSVIELSVGWFETVMTVRVAVKVLP
jgi:hypothetical protein